jgi:hypothetical protein
MISTLVKNLLDLLDSEGITYCHWKSNAALDRSADGRNDLDLLIERSDAAKFKRCVFSLGFKHAQAPYGPARIPGIDDFLSFDFELGRFIHAQAHYCLVLGHDTTKNYRLPVERAFLASRTEDKQYGFPIPSPEWELVIFCFRMILKYSWISAALTSRYQLPPNALNELEYLKNRIKPENIDQILVDHFHYVDKTLFDYCLQTIEPGSSKIRWGLARYRLRLALDCASLRGPFHTTLLGMWRHLTNAIRLRTGIGALKRDPMEGGIVVAIIGDSPETQHLIVELKNWLKQAYHVRIVSTQIPRMESLSSAENKKSDSTLYDNSKSDNKLLYAFENSLLNRTFKDTILYRRMRNTRRLAGKGVIVLLGGEGISHLASKRKSLPATRASQDDRPGDRIMGEIKSYYDEKGIIPDLVIVHKKNVEASSNIPLEKTKQSGEKQHITQPPATYLDVNADALLHAKKFIWNNL